MKKTGFKNCTSRQSIVNLDLLYLVDKVRFGEVTVY